jgi:hypothetical protein
MPNSSRVPAICVGVLATVLVLDASARADNCLLAPGRVARPGVHWVYQTDPTTNRRCWYPIETAPVAAEAYDPYRPPAFGPASPYHPPQPSPFDTFFSWATGSPGSTPPDSAGLDPRAAPGPRPDDARTDDAAPRPPRPPRAAANLTPKPHRPPATAHGDAEPPLTPAERDTLFTEFLRWQQQKPPSQ